MRDYNILLNSNNLKLKSFIERWEAVKNNVLTKKNEDPIRPSLLVVNTR